MAGEPFLPELDLHGAWLQLPGDAAAFGGGLWEVHGCHDTLLLALAGWVSVSIPRRRGLFDDISVEEFSDVPDIKMSPCRGQGDIKMVPTGTRDEAGLPSC